jgi:prepilin-type N-terminal cleavage/methylation domain-containing protein
MHLNGSTSTLVLQTISNVITATQVITASNLSTSTITVNYYSVSRNPVDWTTKRGWYIQWPNSGQRVIYPPETLLGRIVAVDTMTPISAVADDPCLQTNRGRAWNYVIEALTGRGPSTLCSTPTYRRNDRPGQRIRAQPTGDVIAEHRPLNRTELGLHAAHRGMGGAGRREAEAEAEAEAAAGGGQVEIPTVARRSTTPINRNWRRCTSDESTSNMHSGTGIPAQVEGIPMYDRRYPARLTGFTLIELMIVVAVVGIFDGSGPALIQIYIDRARRADARAQAQVAQFMQRFCAMTVLTGRAGTSVLSVMPTNM